MDVQASTDRPLATGADTIVVGVFEDEGVAHDLPGGELEALLHSGEAGRTFKRLALTHHDGRRLILIGLGARVEFDVERAREAAGIAHKRARQCRATTLCWEIPHHVGDEIVEGVVTGTVLSDYRFTRYKAAPDGRAPAGAPDRQRSPRHLGAGEPRVRCSPRLRTAPASSPTRRPMT